MRAQLTDGSMVELVKDCHCVGLHDGPHWVHMDELEHKMNREILEMAQKRLDTAQTQTDVSMAHVLLHRFAEVEIIRLQRKEREMRRQSIERLISYENSASCQESPPRGWTEERTPS